MTREEFEKHSFRKGDVLYCEPMQRVAYVSGVNFENNCIQLMHPVTERKFWYTIAAVSFVTCGSCRLIFCPGEMPARGCINWTPDE